MHSSCFSGHVRLVPYVSGAVLNAELSQRNAMRRCCDAQVDTGTRQLRGGQRWMGWWKLLFSEADPKLPCHSCVCVFVWGLTANTLVNMHCFWPCLFLETALWAPAGPIHLRCSSSVNGFSLPSALPRAAYGIVTQNNWVLLCRTGTAMSPLPYSPLPAVCLWIVTLVDFFFLPHSFVFKWLMDSLLYVLIFT